VDERHSVAQQPGGWLYGRSVDHYQRSIALFPTAKAFSGLGNRYSAAERSAEALEALDAALELEPDLVPALFGRAQVLIRFGPDAPVPDARSAAAASLERVLDLQPDHAQAARELSRLRAADRP
jgi:tetratricopeptide (TPR) repeat protein